ncbi:Concanavalin A-like lectin/glucanase, subgroup [Cordyceps fumosorosea ARSEF 2679]|uniref:Concanavalin A-like lectin/glucanase, subgroup n=1 Tax=Cordyceps fumosorosea (strain ARSEF 2679) TaxID=1081104 RepID=A0A162MLR2_CORFA|nr:Concanavalin A-like lectin/glucanase, subgroup [Cordyceps fumosorosea ARSEF 2679]OAA63870.1 Concanavalin A-like lectin/glucanase, subgroup [Cordyceps fumosorosea ARSEF 2679]
MSRNWTRKAKHPQYTSISVMPAYTKSLVALLAAAAKLTWAQAVVDDFQCDCYVNDGEHPAYYRNHSFWDFRLLPIRPGQPKVIPDVAGNLHAHPTSSLFSGPNPFTDFWSVQQWPNNNQTFPMVVTRNNLYIERDPDGGQGSTFMTMRTSRLPGFQTAAELQSINRVDHASIRVRARSHGAPGACTSVFTYRGAPLLQDVQEADIEMLTREPDATQVHYTNQPSYRTDGTTVWGASHAAALPGGRRWSDWLTHRLDWTPGRTTFSVDGVEAHTQTFQAPRDPSFVLLNAWSDGGVWTGQMAEGGEAFQNVQWIDMLYNILPAGERCDRKCSIDRSPQVGKPVPV